MEDYDNEAQVTEWESENQVGVVSPADALNFLGKLVDFAREAKITERKKERYRMMRDTAIEEITRRFDLAEKLMDRTFDKQIMIIKKQFEIIDKGLAENKFEYVISGMQHITAIAQDNSFLNILQNITTPSEGHKLLEEGNLFIE